MTQSSIDLDSFVSNCLADVKAGKHKKKKVAKKKVAKMKNVREVKLEEITAPAKKPLDYISVSPIQALVQVTVNYTCSCCGTKYRAPNQFLFLKRVNEKFGTLYEKVNLRLDLEAALLTYPREKEERDITVQACAACFDMADLLMAAVQPHSIQLDLFAS